MAADVLAGPARQYLTISDLCGSYPGRRGRLNPATPHRWITRGVKLADGSRLRLKATRFGSRWLIDPTDWQAFLDALTAAQIPDAAPPAPRSPSERSRAAARAGIELDALGVT